MKRKRVVSVGGLWAVLLLPLAYLAWVKSWAVFAVVIIVGLVCSLVAFGWNVITDWLSNR